MELEGTQRGMISLLDKVDSTDIPRRDKLELTLPVGPFTTWKIVNVKI